jgi:non-specific serine/threonine protein kinase
LIGREREVAVVCGSLRGEHVRLLTLTGPGGIGKTRLGLHVAGELRDEFADGVTFVTLAPLRGPPERAPELVASAVARAVGVREGGQRGLVEQLVEALAITERLVVLDNVEHLLGAAPLIGELLAGCPNLRILATSRAVLRVHGERVVRVPPLTVPAASPGGAYSPGELMGVPAVRLFVERVVAVKGDFSLTEGNAAAVVAICRRLDGLPLAIELAAARASLLPPVALEMLLERRLPLLTGGPRDAPARLRTMEAAIAWSYDLLEPPEQALFRRLAVFVGGFTLAAAEAVCGADLDRVGVLVDRSLVQPLAVGGDRPDPMPRFAMLETIREYTLDRLAERGEEEATRAAHASYFLDLAEDAEGPIYDLGRPEDLARLEAEHPNFRAALTWLIAAGRAEEALRLAGALFTFWFHHSHLTEGRAWLERGLGLLAAASPSMRARALTGVGVLAAVQHDFVPAAEALAKAEEWARSGTDRRVLAMVPAALGLLALFQGRLADAARYGEAAARLGEAIDDHGSVFRGRFFVARAAHHGGALERADALYRSLLDDGQRFGPWHLAAVHLALAQIAQAWGDADRAAGHYTAALRSYREQGELWSVAACLEGIAAVGAGRNRDAAARILGAAAALRAAIAAPIFPANRPEHELAVEAVRSALGEAAFTAAWAAGSRLSLSAAIAKAEALLTEMATPAPADPSGTSGDERPAAVRLTPRERAVLRLLTEQRTDKEIGAALFISHRTAMWHVSRILRKLGVASRGEAADYAVRNGLV